MPPLALRVSRLGAAAVLCLACLAIVERTQLASGFAILPGDILDGRIAIAIMEHWYNVLRGLEPWDAPLYFRPTVGALGYNDGYLLFGLPYAGLRAAGLDPYLASEAAGALFRVAGFAGMTAFGTRILRLPLPWALTAACIAMLSNGLYLQTGHIQLLTVGLIPVLAWLVCTAAAALQRPDRLAGVASSCAAALLFGCWLLTAFYTIWFAILFGLVTLAAAVALRPRAMLDALRGMNGRRLIPAVLIAAASLVPFAIVYLPTLRETGGHSYTEALVYTPSVIDFLHVGSRNWLWGDVDRWIGSTLRPGFPDQGEHTVGFTPGLGILALAGCMLAFRRRDRGVWWPSLAAAVIITSLLTLHVGPFSLWWLVFHSVPGASALRVIARFLLVLVMPMALLAAYALSALPRRAAAVLFIPVTLFLGLEQVTGLSYRQLHRDEENRLAASLAPIPEQCQRFYIAVPRPFIGAYGEIVPTPLTPNVDGMFLAELLHLPTPNGDASFLPAGFALELQTPAEFAAAPMRLAAQGLQPGLCGLDLPGRRWIQPDFSYPVLSPGTEAVFTPNSPDVRYMILGWSVSEPLGHWSDGPVASFGLRLTPPPSGDLRLALSASAFPGRGTPVPVTVFANDHRVAQWQPVASPQTLTAIIPAAVVGADGTLLIRLDLDHPVSPAMVLMSDDTRNLGLFVRSLSLTPADSATP